MMRSLPPKFYVIFTVLRYLFLFIKKEMCVCFCVMFLSEGSTLNSAKAAADKLRHVSRKFHWRKWVSDEYLRMLCTHGVHWPQVKHHYEQIIPHLWLSKQSAIIIVLPQSKRVGLVRKHAGCWASLESVWQITFNFASIWHVSFDPGIIHYFSQIQTVLTLSLYLFAWVSDWWTNWRLSKKHNNC